MSDKLRLWTVTFNDGGWHSGALPREIVVARTKEEAIRKARSNSPYPYSNSQWEAWAVELTIKGYEIEVRAV